MKPILTLVCALTLFTKISQAQNDTLFISVNPIANLENALKEHSKARVVVIEQTGEELNWAKVVRKLNKLDSLQALELRSNDLFELPVAFSHLKVNSLTILDNSLLADQPLLEVIMRMPYLKILRLEIEENPEYAEIKLKGTTIESIELYDSKYFGLQQNKDLTIFCHQADQNRTQLVVDDGSANEHKILATYFTKFEQDIPSEEFITEELSSEEISIEELFTEELSTEEKSVNEFSNTTKSFKSGTFEVKYRNVNPPTGSNPVAPMVQTIDNNLPQTIKHDQSGTEINIPKNCFVDKSGKEVTDPVTIQYREYRDPIDIVLSGIPMTEMEGDSMKYYESAGMFEITANVNGEEVFMQPGKKIDLQFSSVPIASQPNFYNFDDKTGEWKDLGAVAKTPAKPANTYNWTLVDAYSKYCRWNALSGNRPDTATLQTRFENTRYINRYSKNEARSKEITINDRHYPVSRCVQLAQARKTRAHGICFKLRTNGKTNPECHYFKDLYFSLDENYTYSQFRRDFTTRKSKFNDIRLVEENGQLTMILKCDTGHVALDVHCVERKKTGCTYVYQDVDAPLKNYKVRLNKRTKGFNRKVKQASLDVRRWEKMRTREMNNSWSTILRELDNTSKCLSKEEIKNYCDSMVSNAPARITYFSKDTLGRALEINAMGIYNLDIKKSIPPSRSVMAYYKDSTNTRVEPHYVYLLIKSVNTALCFSQSGSGALFNVKRLYLPTSRDYAFMMVDRKGEFYYYEKTTEENKNDIPGTKTFVVQTLQKDSEKWNELKMFNLR